jgi:molybdate transport system substrate-binding protein
VTLHVLSAGAAKGLVLALHPRFAAQSSGPDRVTFECAFGALGAMREKLLAGDPCDVIVLTATMIDALIAESRVVAASKVDLGRVLTGIAVPSSQAKPDVSAAGALSASLSSADGIYLPDPERATAGIHFTNVLRELGIYDALRDRLRPHPNGAVAMRAMADASAAGERNLIGCTQVTEINYTEGVRLAGVLPDEFELATMYAAGVCRGSSSPELAREFVRLLGGPESIALRREGGFVV